MKKGVIMNKKVLVLGGGVSGASIAYFLTKKGYEVSVVEANGKDGIGGRARTFTYAGHPYEFGPHVWFWPGGPEDEVNKVIVELSNNELYYIDRKLFTFVEEDNRAYRYPVHFQDIEQMSEKEKIYGELKKNRNEDWVLNPDNLPELGKCMFSEYFEEAIGKTLYSKFMANYTWKMWNIPGDELKTSMIWADRFKHAYSKGDKGVRGLEGYDPMKFENHTLGKGIRFQVYPKKGWNVVWDNMMKEVEVINDSVDRLVEEKGEQYIAMASGDKYNFSDYRSVINTKSIDELFGEDTLPYTGRMMIPLLIPGIGKAFPENAESLHYSGAEFHTRVTEMKVITRHKSPDSLILIEVPVLPDSLNAFPENTFEYAKKHNLYSRKAYPQQSEYGLSLYDSYVERSSKISNLKHCGRLAQFKYWGMPETVNAALQLSKEYCDITNE